MKTPLTLLAPAVLAFLSAAHAGETTKIRVKETPEARLFCAKKELKLAQLGDFARETIPALVKKATDLKLGQGGPVVITYIGYQGDPEQTFTAEIGIPIYSDEDAKEAGYYIRAVPKAKCASTIYQGSLKEIGEAWHKFADEVMRTHQPAGDGRELYFSVAGPESPDNIVELQFPVQ